MRLLTLSDKNLWIDEFEDLRKKILQGADNLRSNYDQKNLDINGQEEATIILDNGIVAFSFLQHRSFWGNASRVLSRYYIVPQHRSRYFKSGSRITEIMLEVQISAAKKISRDFVFVSREYPSTKWQKNYVARHQSWCATFEVLHQVCNANAMSCWQQCAYLSISENDLEFPLPKKSIESVLGYFESPV
jgi:hypothetical protein